MSSEAENHVNYGVYDEDDSSFHVANTDNNSTDSLASADSNSNNK